MSAYAFFQYEALLMSTHHVEEKGEPVHCIVKMLSDLFQSWIRVSDWKQRLWVFMKHFQTSDSSTGKAWQCKSTRTWLERAHKCNKIRFLLLR
jgi:hypothetical protein